MEGLQYYMNFTIDKNSTIVTVQDETVDLSSKFYNKDNSIMVFFNVSLLTTTSALVY